jgi:CAAX protease family protein
MTCFMALVAPIAVLILVPNPVEFWWGYKTAGKPVPIPADVARKMAKAKRYTRVICAVLLIALIWILMRENSVSATSIGIWPSHWTRDLAVGLIGAVVLIGLKTLASKIAGISLGDAHSAEKLYGYDRMLLSWIPMEIFPPFAEEFWRAFCLFAFTTAGYSVAFAVVITALIFGLGHIGLLQLGGAIAQATIGLGLALLYVWTGSLLAPFLVHSIADIHFFYLANRDLKNRSGIGEVSTQGQTQ